MIGELKPLSNNLFDTFHNLNMSFAPSFSHVILKKAGNVQNSFLPFNRYVLCYQAVDFQLIMSKMINKSFEQDC